MSIEYIKAIGILSLMMDLFISIGMLVIIKPKLLKFKNAIDVKLIIIFISIFYIIFPAIFSFLDLIFSWIPVLIPLLKENDCFGLFNSDKNKGLFEIEILSMAIVYSIWNGISSFLSKEWFGVKAVVDNEKQIKSYIYSYISQIFFYITAIVMVFVSVFDGISTYPLKLMIFLLTFIVDDWFVIADYMLVTNARMLKDHYNKILWSNVGIFIAELILILNVFMLHSSFRIPEPSAGLSGLFSSSWSLIFLVIPMMLAFVFFMVSIFSIQGVDKCDGFSITPS